MPLLQVQETVFRFDCIESVLKGLPGVGGVVQEMSAAFTEDIHFCVRRTMLRKDGA